MMKILHDHGISCDRMLKISVQLGEAIVNEYIMKGVVCSPVLGKGLFTTQQWIT